MFKSDRRITRRKDGLLPAERATAFVIEPVNSNDSQLTDTERAAHVRRPFVDTRTPGGTAMDAHGNLYTSDTDKSRVLEITPIGEQKVFARDPHLGGRTVDHTQRQTMDACSSNESNSDIQPWRIR